MKLRLIILTCIMGLTLCGCNDGIDVRQDYEFTLTAWPLPEQVEPAQPVEIRFTLHRTGVFRGTEYNLSWVQTKGKGQMTDERGMIYTDREEYELRMVAGLDTSKADEYRFTLYYLPLSGDNSAFRIVVADNFGKQQEIEIELRVATPKQAAYMK